MTPVRLRVSQTGYRELSRAGSVVSGEARVRDDSPVIIYIIGTGRSGSTVLDTILGSAESAVGVGELRNLHRAYHASDHTCSCGARASECEYWSKVLLEWTDSQGSLVDLDRYEALRVRTERPARALFRCLVPSLRSPLSASYGALTASLFETIARVSKAAFVIDSSKTPARALVLVAGIGLEVRIVHLVRDSRGYVWSRVRDGEITNRAVVQSSITWLVSNLTAQLVCTCAGRARSLRVVYEQLGTDPAGFVSRLGSLSGGEFDTVTTRLCSDASFAPEHCVAGNRLRNRGTFQVRIDEAWKDEMPSRSCRVVWFLTGWLARAYGYHR